MTPGITIHEVRQEILQHNRPDPNRPHSTTAPRLKTATMMKGWISIRDGDGVLRAVVTTSGRGLRLVDAWMPDTVILALSGMRVRDVIDHPGLKGDLTIACARKVDAKDPGSDDIFASRAWFSIETRESMVSEEAGRIPDPKPRRRRRLQDSPA